MSDNSNRKRRKGMVVSDQMSKTLVVETEIIKRHDLYEKYLRRHSRHKVHDEEEDAGIGDIVEIEETRPISKTKNWRLIDVIKEASAQERAKVEKSEEIKESELGLDNDQVDTPDEEQNTDKDEEVSNETADTQEG